MPYTPEPARVRELAERLIVHRAGSPEAAADFLGYDSKLPENEQLNDEDWGALMRAVDAVASTAVITVRFPD